jgi:hypothetical protein
MGLWSRIGSFGALQARRPPGRRRGAGRRGPGGFEQTLAGRVVGRAGAARAVRARADAGRRADPAGRALQRHRRPHHRRPAGPAAALEATRRAPSSPCCTTWTRCASTSSRCCCWPASGGLGADGRGAEGRAPVQGAADGRAWDDSAHRLRRGTHERRDRLCWRNPFAEFAFMRRALVATLALSLGCAPIGCVLVLRRMSLVGDADGARRAAGRGGRLPAGRPVAAGHEPGRLHGRAGRGAGRRLRHPQHAAARRRQLCGLLPDRAGAGRVAGVAARQPGRPDAHAVSAACWRWTTRRCCRWPQWPASRCGRWRG